MYYVSLLLQVIPLVVSLATFYWMYRVAERESDRHHLERCYKTTKETP